jgi:hypothetical protein
LLGLAEKHVKFLSAAKKSIHFFFSDEQDAALYSAKDSVKILKDDMAGPLGPPAAKKGDGRNDKKRKSEDDAKNDMTTPAPKKQTRPPSARQSKGRKAPRNN